LNYTRLRTSLFGPNAGGNVVRRCGYPARCSARPGRMWGSRARGGGRRRDSYSSRLPFLRTSFPRASLPCGPVLAGVRRPVGGLQLRRLLLGSKPTRRSHLEASLPLTCFQRLSLPSIATRAAQRRDRSPPRTSRAKPPIRDRPAIHRLAAVDPGPIATRRRLPASRSPHTPNQIALHKKNRAFRPGFFECNGTSMQRKPLSKRDRYSDRAAIRTRCRSARTRWRCCRLPGRR